MSPKNGFILQGNRLTLYLHVQPRTSKLMWGKLQDNRIKLYLTTPPIEGQANKQCISFLSKMLKVPKSSISILQGINNRSKVIQVNNIDTVFWESVFQKIQNTP